MFVHFLGIKEILETDDLGQGCIPHQVIHTHELAGSGFSSLSSYPLSSVLASF